MSSKLFSLRSASQIARRFKEQKKRTVFTNGCFDILHAGHVDYLEKARTFGDVLIVGLNSDESTRRLKGPHRPVNSEQDRAKVLSALSCVDLVVIFNEDTPLKTIKFLKPDVLVKGSDWSLREIVGVDEVLSWGGTVKRVKFLKGRSTSGILKKLM